MNVLVRFAGQNRQENKIPLPLTQAACCYLPVSETDVQVHILGIVPGPCIPLNDTIAWKRGQILSLNLRPEAGVLCPTSAYS